MGFSWSNYNCIIIIKLLKETNMGKLYAGIATFALAIIVTLSGLTSIDPGEVGLQVKMLGSDRGMSQETLDTGTHWINPITYDVAVYDTRKQQYSISDMNASTKDGQPIQVDISLEIGLSDAKVPVLHEKVGYDYFDQIVYPALRSGVRNATSTQNSDQVYTGAGRAAIQDSILTALSGKFTEYGIDVDVNLRDVTFTNQKFVATLERKAVAAENEVIKKRDAAAAEQEAIRVANIAEGAKQKAIKEAEAKSRSAALEGIGLRKKLEQEAKGNLAIARAKAEGTRLQVQAYGSGKTYASVKWAENLAPKLKVYGIPTGAAGTTSLMDLNGMLQGKLTGMAGK